MIQGSRPTALLDGDFVLFFTGMHISAPLKVHKRWSVAAAKPRMLKELHTRPELGFLHAETRFARTILAVVGTPREARGGLQAARDRLAAGPAGR